MIDDDYFKCFRISFWKISIGIDITFGKEQQERHKITKKYDKECKKCEKKFGECNGKCERILKYQQEIENNED